jgi:acetylornithine/succinyldiaminopimelate/putrescine aminotransferase
MNSIVTARQAEARHLLQVYSQLGIEPESASGVYLHLGRRKIIDFYGGHAVAALGYAHPDLLAALTEQARTMYFQSNAVALKVRAEALLWKYMVRPWATPIPTCWPPSPSRPAPCTSRATPWP